MARDYDRANCFSDMHNHSNRRLKKRRANRVFRIESLEPRLLLHGGGHDEVHAEGHDEESQVHYDEVTVDLTTIDSASGDSGSTLSATNPLSSIPAINSRPGAAASVYLDFNGHFESNWGGYNNVSTPVFDQDGDATTFSDAELATIRQVWQRVTEDFAPFNINVTTVDPGNFSNGVALRVSIGGDGSWIGPYGGVAYINSFTNSIANTVYVFSDNLGNGFAKYVAEASSHESGHAFGLSHQSLYDGSGNLVQSYYSGDGTHAPIMGLSYYTAQSLWRYGTSYSSSTYQNDISVIANGTNGFGLRVDDHGGSRASASTLTSSGGSLSGNGVIERSSDWDFFSFSTGTGTLTLNVNVNAQYANLDVSIQLRSSSGNVITTANPTNSLSASISVAVSTGTYYLAVTTDGQYGELGHYQISGTVSPGMFSGGVFRNGRWFFDEDGVGGTAESTVAWGMRGDRPIVGDWNGDGNDEMGIFRRGQWFLDVDGAAGAAEQKFRLGKWSDIAVVGDWNGDGTDDVGVFRNGAWYLDAAGNDGVADRVVYFGGRGDRPVVGDWDGDGTDDLGIYRNGRWYFDLDGNGGGAEHSLWFGKKTDRPVVGDWDQDGVDEIGIHRNGYWYLDVDGNAGAAESIVHFGGTYDLPVTGRWSGFSPGLSTSTSPWSTDSRTSTAPAILASAVAQFLPSLTGVTASTSTNTSGLGAIPTSAALDASGVDDSVFAAIGQGGFTGGLVSNPHSQDLALLDALIDDDFDGTSDDHDGNSTAIGHGAVGVNSPTDQALLQLVEELDLLDSDLIV